MIIIRKSTTQVFNFHCKHIYMFRFGLDTNIGRIENEADDYETRSIPKQRLSFAILKSFISGEFRSWISLALFK